MTGRRLLTLLTKELATHAEQTFTNFGDTLYSSVSIVFHIRTPAVKDLDEYAINEQSSMRVPFQALECLGEQDASILFMQRAIDPKDFHSGQLSLPGGKVEHGESDYHAAIRETEEEVGLNLFSSAFTTLYLGRSPKNFYVRRIKNNKYALYAITHIFLIISPDDIPLNINPSEVNEARFIPFDYFYKNVNARIQPLRLATAAHHPYQYVPLLVRPFLYYRLRSHPLNFNANQYDLGFEGAPLWGLTYYIMCQMLAVMVYADEKEIPNEIVVELLLNIAGGHYLNIQVGQDDVIGRMISSAFKSQYLRKRMNTVNYKNILPKL